MRDEVWKVDRGFIIEGFVGYCKEFGFYFRYIGKFGRFKVGGGMIDLYFKIILVVI